MLKTHPSDVELLAFVVGNLPDAEFSALESHLEDCDECTQRATFDYADDTLVKLVAAAGTRMNAERSIAATPAPQDTLAHTGTGSRQSLAEVVDRPEPPAIFAGHPRYRLLRWIGAGGMGSVWEAQQLALDRRVAIKVIRPEFVARPGAAERFRREARTVARMSHANIVTAYDAEEINGTHYLVMEFVDGENLGELLGKGALPVAEACRAVRDAALGLAHAHAHGLVHRDIKPHNLIRTRDGVTKILDFGLATAEAFVDGLTSADMMLGTPDYIAPEQAQDARSADSAADIYSLGCTLYALLSGAAPFAGGTALAKLDGHRHGSVPSLKNVPRELATLVEQMMAKRPQDRPTAAAVAETLGDYGSESRLQKIPEVANSPARPKSSPRLLTAILLGALALAAGVIFKIQLDKREIEIESSDPNIKIVTRRNGELVRIENSQTNEAWQLDTKRLRLKPDGSELEIELPSQQPIVLSRQGNQVVKIQWRELNEKAVKGDVAAAEAKSLAPWRTLRGHSGEIRDAAFSRDGHTAYTASVDGTVKIWNVEQAREIGQLDHRHCVMALALAEGDKTLLSVTYPIVTGNTSPGRLFAWDLTTNKEAAQFPVIAEDSLIHVAVNPAGTIAATVSVKGQIRIWSIAARKELKSWLIEPKVTQVPVHVAWSPDGKRVSVAGDSSLSVWDVAAGELKCQSDIFGRGLTSSEFTPDGKQIVSCGWEGIVRVIDAQDGKLIRKFDINRYAGRVAAARLAVRQGQILGGCFTSINVLNLGTGTDIAEFTGVEGPVNALKLSADSGMLISANVDKVAQIWKLAALPASVPPAVPPPAATTLDEAKTIVKPYRTLEGHTQRTRTAIFSRDGRTVYSGGDDSVVRIWDVEAGRETGKLTADNWVIALGLSDDGNLLLGSTLDRIEAWDLKTGKKAQPFPALENGDKVQGIAVRPDGRKVAGAYVSGMVRVWDVAERKLEKEFPPPGTRASYRVAWTPDGSQLIAGMDETLMVFDYPSGTPVHRIWKLRGITNVGVSGDSEIMVAHTWDAAVEVYDLKTGRMQREFNVGLIDGKKGVSGVIVDRNHLVTSGRGDFLDFWTMTGERLATFVGHTDQVVTVNISPDRQWLASASEDTTVRIWKVPEGLK